MEEKHKTWSNLFFESIFFAMECLKLSCFPFFSWPGQKIDMQLASSAFKWLLLDFLDHLPKKNCRKVEF